MRSRRSRVPGRASSVTGSTRGTSAGAGCSLACRAVCTRASACSTASSVRSTRRAGRNARWLKGDTGSLVYVVFDLLELDAEPLVDEPWAGRRDRLAALLDDQAGELLLSRAYDDGRELRAAARERGLGIVAKHRKAAYPPASSATTGGCSHPDAEVDWNVATQGSIR